MAENIRVLRPPSPRAGGDATANTFTREDDALLRSIISPGSARNPFSPAVQVRNALLIELLRLLGKRRGEALNIRVREVDLVRRQIDIVRRADDAHDPRVNQPLVKTREHTVPIGPSVVDLVNRYLADRRAVPGATKQPYLLVTHKAGPTQGQAMTIEALKEVFRTIKKAEPQLAHLHPHLLRHFNSDETARAQLDGAGSSGAGDGERHRRQRNYLAGRAPESKVDSLYTQRETERQARAASLRTQEELARAVERAAKPTSKDSGKP
jgi:integrase